MVKNARRASCIGSGESRGTIQVGGIPYRPGCRLQGNGDSTRRVQGGAGWRVGRGSNHKNHKFTADDSTDCVECFRAGCGWRQPAINGETKRCGSSQARPTRSCDDSTRLDEGQPEHPEAGLHHHHPPARSRLLCLRSRRTQTIGHREAALRQRRQKTRGQRGSPSNRPLCCSRQVLSLGANHF